MAAPDAEALLKVLRCHWGYTAFRPLQLEAIQATLAGRDVLLILPTSGGKSLAFQLPPLVQAHAVTVVVTPLLALAKDQVGRCLDCGIDTATWTSETPEARLAGVERDLASGEPCTKLLYTTPESLRTPRLLQALQAAHEHGQLLSVAVDESHCVSEWGHDFRPAYMQLGALRDAFPGVPFIAVTATATREVQDSIAEALRLRQPALLKQSFNRPNLRFEVRHKELVGDGSDEAVLADLVAFIREAHAGQCGIVYCFKRKTCDWLAGALVDAGVDASAYHAGKDASARARAQNDWLDGGTQCVVATIAFGMGIDKPDVRWVAHWNPARSIEGYYQEAGRAGRDGRPAACRLYTSKQDLKELQKLERGCRTGALARVAQLAAPCCRRRALLGFLGERRGGCGEGEQACDFCQDRQAVLAADRRLEAREEAQWAGAAAAVVAVAGSNGGGGGGAHKPLGVRTLGPKRLAVAGRAALAPHSWAPATAVAAGHAAEAAEGQGCGGGGEPAALPPAAGQENSRPQPSAQQSGGQQARPVLRRRGFVPPRRLPK